MISPFKQDPPVKNYRDVVLDGFLEAAQSKLIDDDNKNKIKINVVSIITCTNDKGVVFKHDSN